jgi:methionine synthase II (cobalamin-independent)
LTPRSVNPAPIPVTGIGSLPHGDVTGAVRFALVTSSDFAPLPQLPSYSPAESILEQFAAWDGFAVPGPAHGFAALGSFSEALSANGRASAKVQLLGPVTAAACGLSQRVPRPLGEQCHRLLAALAEAINLPPNRIVTQIDEPMLSSGDDASRAELRHAIRALQGRGHPVWIHCCGTVDWERMLACDADGYSVDAWLTAPTAGEWPSGKLLVLGAVPTDGARSADECVEHALAWLRDARIAPTDWPSRVVITPACGLGLRTIAQADEAMRLCAEVAQRLSAFPAAAAGD